MIIPKDTADPEYLKLFEAALSDMSRAGGSPFLRPFHVCPNRGCCNLLPSFSFFTSFFPLTDGRASRTSAFVFLTHLQNFEG